MDTAKAQQNVIEQNRSRQNFATTLKAKMTSLHHRLQSLQGKLILPYMLLTIVLAAFGIFVITTLVSSSFREHFDNSLFEASRVANDGIINMERNQLDRLRFLIFTDGMAQAMFDKNSDQIYNLMRPVLANSQINLIAAIDTSGKEIVTFGKDPNTKEYHKQSGVDFSGVSIVNKVIEGKVDDQGDKYVEVIKLAQGPILFTSAPVRDSSDKLVGVMMVGTYLRPAVTDLEKQAVASVIILDSKGSLVEMTLSRPEEGYEPLLGFVKDRQLTAKAGTRINDLNINHRPYAVAYGPLIIRNQPVGWVGVVLSADYWVNQVNTSRNLFIWIFAIATLGMIVIGYWLARNIAWPILMLRDMSQEVASGDLEQHIGLRRTDEIGELGNSFDVMTQQLSERTAEASRLYDETVQRNKELKEINEKLEAAQLQLIQSEKLASIGQLTAGIVHDVKNPFAVIMGMAEVLGEDDKLDESTLHGLKVIRESAVKGNTIVSDLLKFARQSRPEMRYMDLRETVQTSMRLTAYLTRRYNTLGDLPETSLMVTYDAQQIEQVLINMIHNAVQAMPNGGALTISLKKVDDTAQVSVQDSGCGIPPEHLKRIFDPFFTTKPEGEGTGLGLSVSYGIVANHRGRIDVESEVGKGTRFTIVLPITQPSNMQGDLNS